MCVGRRVLGVLTYWWFLIWFWWFLAVQLIMSLSEPTLARDWWFLIFSLVIFYDFWWFLMWTSHMILIKANLGWRLWRKGAPALNWGFLGFGLLLQSVGSLLNPGLPPAPWSSSCTLAFLLHPVIPPAPCHSSCTTSQNNTTFVNGFPQIFVNRDDTVDNYVSYGIPATLTTNTNILIYDSVVFWDLTEYVLTLT